MSNETDNSRAEQTTETAPETELAGFTPLEEDSKDTETAENTGEANSEIPTTSGSNLSSNVSTHATSGSTIASTETNATSDRVSKSTEEEVHSRSGHSSGTINRKKKLQPIDSSGFVSMCKLKDYDIIEKLGQGTFGVVQKARCKKTGALVAIKQLINHSAKEGFPITAMREITILKQLNHENILRITEMVFEDPKIANSADLVTHRGCFYTVSPYMCSDLVGLLENPAITLELSQIKCLMKQLLHGIQYIHEQKFLHRDIKAANILIDFDGILKIADFGLARTYHGTTPRLGNGPGGGERNYTGLVVTRWYRPPELLLGERKYTTAVDLWGIGCVFGELFHGKPILMGRSDVHQAQLVFGLVGPPNDWTRAALLPNKSDFNIGLTCKRTLEARFKDLMPADGISLLSGLLTLDPYKRMNALDALNHEFFTNEPLPVEPHEMPHWEECHEIDKERFKKFREGIAPSGQPPQRAPRNGPHPTPSGPMGPHPTPKTSAPRDPRERDPRDPRERDPRDLREREYQTRSAPRSAPKTTPGGPSGFGRKNTSSYVPREAQASSYIPKEPKSSYVPRESSSYNSRETSSYIPRESSKYVPREAQKSSYVPNYNRPPTQQSNYRSSYGPDRTPSDNSRHPDRLRERGTRDARPHNLPVRPRPHESEEPKDEFKPSGGVKRAISTGSEPDTRLKALKRERDGNESELSDVDGDFKNGEEEKLNDFLDYEGFQKDSEYRKMSHERVKYNQDQKRVMDY